MISSLRNFIWVCVNLIFAGCANNEIILPLAVSDSRVASLRTINVATIRKPSADPLAVYSGDRSDTLGFAEISVSIPKNRAPGTIEYPRKTPELSKQFATVGYKTGMDEAAFIASLNKQLAAIPPSDRTIFLFVHGYNTNFASGIFRQAQMAHDFRVSGIAVSFSWASAGRTPLYLYDRDSAQLAREGLRQTLEILARTNDNGIMLLGHSMGGLVTMEALRDIGLRKNRKTLKKIDTLILASPDIDERVFDQQLAAIDPLPQPFILFVSKKDRALQASQQLRGGQNRLGEGANIEKFREKGIAVVDLTNVEDGGDGINHTTFATSKTVMDLARSGTLGRDALLGRTKAKPLKPIGDGIGAVSDLASAIIYLPAKIVGVR